MSRRFRNILDSLSDSESDHEPQSKQSRPSGTMVDWLNALVCHRSTSPGNATVSSHNQQNRTTLTSSPSTSSPSPPREDNYDNVNGNTSTEESNLMKKLVKDACRIFHKTLIWTVTVDVTAVMSVVTTS